MSRMEAAPRRWRAWVVVLCAWSAGCAQSTSIGEEAKLSQAALYDECPCDPETKAEQIELGRRIFEDRNLSASGTQSCASCHSAERAFTGNNRPGDALFPVSVGAFEDLLGSRNAPTIAYMAYSPALSFVAETEAGETELTPTGGQFWDGRVDSLEQQASKPFLNPREMALPDQAAVVERVKTADYAALFQRVYGDVFADTQRAYEKVTAAIAAFERSERFATFSSKFDAVLRGEAAFSAQEERGFALFKDPEKGNCIACHAGDEHSQRPQDWLFTDFTYDNLGIPRNPMVPDNADPSFFDLGLCAQENLRERLPALASADDYCGAFKVPTLRNIALTAPYMHNGYFRELRDVVDFYVTRDTDAARWYPCHEDGSVDKFNDLPAAYRGNVNHEEAPYDRKAGEEPRLTPDEIDDVVAFLQTLSDGYRAE